MSGEKNHTKQQPDPLQEVREIISGSRISWHKTKEQVWTDLQKKLEKIPSVRTRYIGSIWIKLSVAAMIILLVGTPAIMQLYTKTIQVPSGRHLSYVLPDNSSVDLNAQSIMKYKPLLWKFFRHIRFEGEAYFRIQPGKTFKVTSDNGTTEVLGTSFTIYSRDTDYMVTCLAGRVRVIENTGNNEVVLHAGQKTEINPVGMLEVQSNINTELALSWLHNRFHFTAVPVSKVFQEIGRQYNIQIQIPDDIDFIYTGTFNKSTSVETVLNLVCRPFNLKFIRKSNDEYIILKNT
jgi:ferric-dicitrate binding protein FerR (iron transport regulator)